MKEYKEVYNKLKESYTSGELADSIMIPEESGKEEEEQIRAEFVRMRMKRRQEMSEKDKVLSGLLNTK